MESIRCTDVKMQCCPFLWRRVQLQLSHEQFWTKRHHVPVLSVTRRRRRPLSSTNGRVLIDQIPLDSSTRLLTQNSRDLRRLCFTLQRGDKQSRFQAPDEVVYDKWRVAIVEAIDRAEKTEQTLQNVGTVGIGLKKKKRCGEFIQFNRGYSNVYARDATNCKLIRLHQPATVMVTTRPQLVNFSTPKEVEPISDHADGIGQFNDAIQYESDAADKKVMVLSQLVDAVNYECSVISDCDIDVASSSCGDCEESVDFGHFVDSIKHSSDISRAITDNVATILSDKAATFDSPLDAFEPQNSSINTPAKNIDHHDTNVEFVPRSPATHHVRDPNEVVSGRHQHSSCSNHEPAMHMPNFSMDFIHRGNIQDTKHYSGDPDAVIQIQTELGTDLDTASTATCTSSDGEDETLVMSTPKQAAVYRYSVFTHPMIERSISRQPTARETLRRRLMETETRKHGMLPYESPAQSPLQPEEELEDFFAPRWLGYRSKSPQTS